MPDESDDRHSVRNADEQGLHAVHGVNIFHPQKRKQREEENSRARSEVANVHGNHELDEETCQKQTAWKFLVAWRVTGAVANPCRHPPADHKYQGGDQQQPRHDMHERGGRRPQQDKRAQHASENAHSQQRRQQTASIRREHVAVSRRACQRPRPKRDGVGCVRGDRRHTDNQQCREGYETASAGDGIDCPGQESSEEQEDGMIDLVNVQVKEYPVRGVVSLGFA